MLLMRRPSNVFASLTAMAQKFQIYADDNGGGRCSIRTKEALKQATSDRSRCIYHQPDGT